MSNKGQYQSLSCPSTARGEGVYAIWYSCSREKVGIDDRKKDASSNDAIVGDQSGVRVIENVLIVGPNHGKAKDIIDGIFSPPAKFQGFCA